MDSYQNCTMDTIQKSSKVFYQNNSIILKRFHHGFWVVRKILHGLLGKLLHDIVHERYLREKNSRNSPIKSSIMMKSFRGAVLGIVTSYVLDMVKRPLLDDGKLAKKATLCMDARLGDIQKFLQILTVFLLFQGVIHRHLNAFRKSTADCFRKILHVFSENPPNVLFVIFSATSGILTDISSWSPLYLLRMFFIDTFRNFHWNHRKFLKNFLLQWFQ